MNLKNKIIILISITAIFAIIYLTFLKPVNINGIDSFKNFVFQNGDAKNIYLDVIKSIDTSSIETNLIAIYYAQTIMKEDTETYNNFWHQLEISIKKNSGELIKILLAHQDSLKNNPFYHQIYLNLVSSLDIESELKAKALAKSLEQRIDFNSKNEITEQNASIVVALILLKKNNSQVKHLLSSIKKGMELNSASAKSLHEYKARIKTYFPNINLDSDDLKSGLL
jgi:hypothetical protein